MEDAKDTNSLLEGHVWVPTRARFQLTEALTDLSNSIKGFIAPIIKDVDRPEWQKPTSFLVRKI